MLRNVLRASARSAPGVVARRAALFSSSASGSKYTVKQIFYEENGSPADVLKLRESTLPDPSTSLRGNEVFLKQLCAPLNPADFNLVEGTYGVKAKLPATGGNEGLFEVIAVGPDSTLSAGDWVLPTIPGFGTWRSHALTEEFAVMKVPKTVPMEQAATISVNPCTAYRMLADFVDLAPGDAVIQNGATSGVGKAAIQIAKARGLKSINIVRDRPDMAKTRAELMCLGADVVLPESALRNRAEVSAALTAAGITKPPQLALNCVGGSLVGDMTRYMGGKAVIVTYGGMSKKPVTVGTGPFIFNDLTLKGFWMTRWNAEHAPSDPARLTMLRTLFNMIEKGQLKSDAVVLPIDTQEDVVTAVTKAGESHKAAKVLVAFPASEKGPHA